MTKKQSMRGMIVTLSVASSLLGGCHGEDGNAGAGALEDSEHAVGTAQAAPDALIAQVGVQPGPVLQAQGAAAVLAAVRGEVQVRRLGEESFVGLKRDDALYLGDQLRAGEGAQATVLFADESTAELAELSTLAIGSRIATADPASSAALLMGVARFSVTPRAPGEGPFLVFTPAAVIATKGTAFGVGVAADGDARVGVESGAVEVAGAAAFDAPITLEQSAAVEISSAGALAAATPWPVDDWGAWRVQAETGIDLAAVAEAHANAMATLSVELDATYAALAELGTQVAAFEAQASAQASANDSAGYEARLPDAVLAIDASFLTGLRLEFLTHAYAAHAALASELYLRHPEVVAWASLEPRVRASVLWPKRFDATAAVYFEPLRFQYYVHHPVGRAHAQFVGIVVPEFYASVTPPELSAKAHAKLKFKAFMPPQPAFTATARAVWIAAPSMGWNSNVKFKAKAPRGKLAFWVRPPNMKCEAILGGHVTGKITPVFAVRAPSARGQLKAKWGIVLGQKIQLSPPNLKASAQARAGFKADAALKADAAMPDLKGRLAVKVGLPSVKAKVSGSAKANTKMAADMKAKAKAQADATSKAAASAQARLKAGAGAGASIKLKPPTIKAEAKGSAGFKLGN